MADTSTGFWSGLFAQPATVQTQSSSQQPATLQVQPQQSGVQPLQQPQLALTGPPGTAVQTSGGPLAGLANAFAGLGDRLTSPAAANMMLALSSAIAPENSWQQKLNKSVGAATRAQLLAKALSAPPANPYAQTQTQAATVGSTQAPVDTNASLLEKFKQFESTGGGY